MFRAKNTVLLLQVHGRCPELGLYCTVLHNESFASFFYAHNSVALCNLSLASYTVVDVETFISWMKRESVVDSCKRWLQQQAVNSLRRCGMLPWRRVRQ